MLNEPKTEVGGSPKFGELLLCGGYYESHTISFNLKSPVNGPFYILKAKDVKLKANILCFIG